VAKLTRLAHKVAI